MSGTCNWPLGSGAFCQNLVSDRTSKCAAGHVVWPASVPAGLQLDAASATAEVSSADPFDAAPSTNAWDALLADVRSSLLEDPWASGLANDATWDTAKEDALLRSGLGSASGVHVGADAYGNAYLEGHHRLNAVDVDYLSDEQRDAYEQMLTVVVLSGHDPSSVDVLWRANVSGTRASQEDTRAWGVVSADDTELVGRVATAMAEQTDEYGTAEDLTEWFKVWLNHTSREEYEKDVHGAFQTLAHTAMVDASEAYRHVTEWGDQVAEQVAADLEEQQAHWHTDEFAREQAEQHGWRPPTMRTRP